MDHVCEKSTNDEGRDHRSDNPNCILLGELYQRLTRFCVVISAEKSGWKVSVKTRFFMLDVFSAEIFPGYVEMKTGCFREKIKPNHIKKFCLINARLVESGKHRLVTTNKKCGKLLGQALRRIIAGALPSETVLYSPIIRGWATAPFSDIDSVIMAKIVEIIRPRIRCIKFEEESQWHISEVFLTSEQLEIKIANVTPVGFISWRQMFDVETYFDECQDCSREDVWEMFVEMLVGFSAEISQELIAELTVEIT